MDPAESVPMIVDLTVLREVRESWHGVEALQEKVHGALLGAFAEGSSFAIFAADATHTLPFVHACAVLNDVLQQLSREKHFRSRSIFLGALLSASRSRLPWIDFLTIQEAATRRNGVAHHGAVLPRADSWRFIDAIKTELVAWKVL